MSVIIDCLKWLHGMHVMLWHVGRDILYVL